MRKCNMVKDTPLRKQYKKVFRKAYIPNIFPKGPALWTAGPIRHSTMKPPFGNVALPVTKKVLTVK